VPHDPEAPFGELESGSLEIEGPVVQMQWRNVRDNSVPEADPLSGIPGRENSTPSEGFLSEFRWKDEKKARYIDYKGESHLDALEEETDWEEVLFLYIACDDVFFCEGIILTKAGDDRYRRIGYFIARMSLQGDDDIDGRFGEIPHVIKWPKLTLVVI
jgi:hypothetical protein